MIDYLVDTDWAVDFLKGRQQATELFDSLAEPGLAISIISYAELYEGVMRAANNESLVTQLTAFRADIDMISLDEETARIFAERRADLRTRGLTIPDHDLWIASTALRHDLTLLTRDKHFERVPALRRR